MGDGTTVSTTPMEWRLRVRAAAQARPVAFHECDMGRRILLLRTTLSGGFTVPRRQVKIKTRQGRFNHG